VGTDANSLVVFDRSAGDGTLSFVETRTDGIGGVSGLHDIQSVAVSGDGTSVYTVARDDNALAEFDRDGLAGTLTQANVYRDGFSGVDGLRGAQDVIVSNDGACVYAVSVGDDAIAIFDRHAGTGDLTFLAALTNGPSNALGNPMSLAASPDDRNVYVAASGSDTLAIYSRALPGCALTLIDVVSSTTLVDVDFGQPTAVATSPDGRHVYVALAGDDAVAAFDRNDTTGLLTFIERLANRVDGVDGLTDVRAIAVSPDGRHVITGSARDNAVALFARNDASGRLHAIAYRQNGVNDLTMSGVEDVAVSPDSKHVYAAAASSSVLAGFELLDAVACPAVPALGCRTPTDEHAASLVLRDRDPDRRDDLKWKWKKGELTITADFGDYAQTTSFALCLYDATGLRTESDIVPGACSRRACWRRAGSGLRYRDKNLSPNGLMSVAEKDGLNGRAKLVLKARGPLLAMPALPLALPATIQLISSDGECWESLHSSAKTNDVERFKALSD
jgi:6-phosphogluconolactonase (cycloisomerase 2 family)